MESLRSIRFGVWAKTVDDGRELCMFFSCHCSIESEDGFLGDRGPITRGE